MDGVCMCGSLSFRGKYCHNRDNIHYLPTFLGFFPDASQLARLEVVVSAYAMVSG
jgi:hypothetical protein